MNERERSRPRRTKRTSGRYAPRLEAGKRLNLIQARLNDNERAALDELKLSTGLNDSGLVRWGIQLLTGTLQSRR